MIDQYSPRPRPADLVWWKQGVIYQIYPRSFQDTDGDGVGDLRGIIARLDYLVDLGVDAIWLSPIFRSPMADFGYDVEDHLAIDPLFGDLDTFDQLVADAHRRGLKLILDYIPNHTSDRHLWFRESRSSRTSAKRDWYVWRNAGPDGGPPNNWLSEFGGPAWTWDDASGQYYYHAFLPSQPDLNWRNAEVTEAMGHVLRFWLDRGVDGFRVDAIHHLFEDEALRDNPKNPCWSPDSPPAEALIRDRTIDQPEVHAAVAAMRRLVDGYDGGRVLIGEAYLPLNRLIAYYGEALDGFHLPFNFHLMSIAWTPSAIAGLIRAYEACLPRGGWPNWVLGNHDRSRLASRIGPQQARVAAMLLLTLRGTPTLYQGDELGMTDVPIPPGAVRDPWELNVPGLGLGRDPVRSPMRWTSGRGAGFTVGKPWLPLGEGWRAQCVETQRQTRGSILNLYRDLLNFRRHSRELNFGAIEHLAAEKNLLRYERRWGSSRLLILLELGGRNGVARIPPGTIVMCTSGEQVGRFVDGVVSVQPNSGMIIRVE